MPAVLIEVRRPYSPAEEAAIMDAVHAALVEAFQVPAHDRNIRLIAHDPARFASPPAVEQPEFRTIVTIDCFAGRSVDAKRALYRAIADGLEAVGIPGKYVTTILHEIPRENWGLVGGLAAIDADLGFNVNV